MTAPGLLPSADLPHPWGGAHYTTRVRHFRAAVPSPDCRNAGSGKFREPAHRPHAAKRSGEITG
jgi:hypothetical protein